MDAERWRRIHDLFQGAMTRPAVERRAFVDDASLGDEALRQQVAELLDAHEHAAGFLETAAFSDAVRVLASSDQPGAYRAGTDFRGTDRYTVVRRLGAGGMGIVYEVRDRTRDETVALKTLLRASAADILRLKREFRSLADVAHPNLVSLYELVVDGEHCFFTMELVTGVNLVDYVRGNADRVRSVLRQLVAGLSALHDTRKLHRDIKPSNVLVTAAGRVVILDFGLISDASLDGFGDVAGTPAYIAPEQAPGVIPSEANDWYSVGVTLYEALTGHVPFEGRSYDVLDRKKKSDPPAPSEIAPDVPQDLSDICMGLLCRDPARRLTGVDVMQRFGEQTVRAGSPARSRATFVGRVQQLDVLNRAFLGMSHGRAGIVCIHGPSGIGKSALAQRFLDQLLALHDVVILRGRCYEHESVPYKALDGVIDSLAQYLGGLERSHAEALMPIDVLALPRLFPVMLQVRAIAAAAQLEPDIQDPLVLRQRAFSSLRELLTRMADRQPLVIHIDDLHWADADSTLLLEELLRPPRPPALLTITCFRTEEIDSKPFLQRLIERSESAGCMVVPLGPMTDEEARALVASFIPADSRVTEDHARGIVIDGGGNPFLLEQLAHYAGTDDIARDRGASFVEMLERRVRALPAGARRFLETLAICARPVAAQVVHDACGLVGDERPLVGRLRSERFVRSSGSALRVEIYHDRIRDTLAAQISTADERRIHGLMARTLIARGADDPEALYVHYRGAGDRVKASIQAGLAAKKSDVALAFDRAAFFYRSALELAPDSPVHFEWKEGLAGALANAGRPTEAADVYLQAVEGAHATARVELQRRAAEQLLIGGHVDRGLDVIRAVVNAVGLRLAPGPRAALVSFLIRRARLRWRGLEFLARDAAQIPADELFRIDTCWSLSTGLALVDAVLAADFHTRHLLLALDTGEPHRIAGALAMEAGFTAVAGGPAMRRTAMLIERARTMAEQVGDPRIIALCTLTSGLAAYMVGEWKNASVLCDRALGILQRCVGVTWELNLAQNILLTSLLQQGEIHEVSRRLPDILAAARERGNLYIETELRTLMIATWLAADDPDGGERQARDIMARWAHRGFHRQHYNFLLTRIRAELYRGRAEEAWRLIVDNWTAVRRSHVLRIQWVRIEALYNRARSALLMAASGREPRRFLSLARADVRRIEREKMPWSDPLALLVGAGVAHLEGNSALARERLTVAIDGFDRADMALYAAVARRRLAALVGGDRRRDLMRESDEWVRAQHIRNPHRMAGLIAPGLPDVES